MKILRISLLLTGLTLGCDSDNGISSQPEVLIAPFAAEITGEINADLTQDRYDLNYDAHANSQRFEMFLDATFEIGGSEGEKIGLRFTYDNARPEVGSYPIAGTRGSSQFYSQLTYSFKNLTQENVFEFRQRFEARSGLLTITYADRSTIKGTFTLEAEKVAAETVTSEGRFGEPLHGEGIAVSGAFHVNVFPR